MPPTGTGLATVPVPAPLPCAGTGDGCHASRRRISAVDTFDPASTDDLDRTFWPTNTPEGTGDGCHASRLRPSDVNAGSTLPVGRTAAVDAPRGDAVASKRTPIHPAADTTERQTTHKDDSKEGRDMI